MKILFRFESTITLRRSRITKLESVESGFTNSDDSVYIQRVAVLKSAEAPCLLLSIDPAVLLSRHRI